MKGTEAALRRELRRRVLKGVKIVFYGERSTIDCTVRELSATGARLLVVSSVGVPDRFELARPPRLPIGLAAGHGTGRCVPMTFLGLTSAVHSPL